MTSIGEEHLYINHHTHSFETQLESVGRTGNQWVDRFEHTFGSAMQLLGENRLKLVKLDKNQ